MAGEVVDFVGFGCGQDLKNAAKVGGGEGVAGDLVADAEVGETGEGVVQGISGGAGDAVAFFKEELG